MAVKTKGIALVNLSVSARNKLEWTGPLGRGRGLETYKVDFCLASLLNLEWKGGLQSGILISKQ